MSHVVELGRRYHVNITIWELVTSPLLPTFIWRSSPVVTERSKVIHHAVVYHVTGCSYSRTRGERKEERNRKTDKELRWAGPRLIDSSLCNCSRLPCAAMLWWLSSNNDWLEWRGSFFFFYLFSFSCVTSACFTWQYEPFLIIQIWIEIRFAIWKLPMCDGIYLIYLQYRSTE